MVCIAFTQLFRGSANRIRKAFIRGLLYAQTTLSDRQAADIKTFVIHLSQLAVERLSSQEYLDLTLEVGKLRYWDDSVCSRKRPRWSPLEPTDSRATIASVFISAYAHGQFLSQRAWRC